MASTPFLERDYHSLIVITWWAIGEMLRIKSQPHRGKIGYLSFALYFAVLIAVVFVYSIQQIGYLIVLILHGTGYFAYTALPAKITGAARAGMLGKTSTDVGKKVGEEDRGRSRRIKSLRVGTKVSSICL
jgi:hypothetical protein